MFTNSQNSSVKRPVGSLGGGYEREDRNCLEVIQLLEDNSETGRYSRFQVTGVIEIFLGGKKKFGKSLFVSEERIWGGIQSNLMICGGTHICWLRSSASKVQPNLFSGCSNN